MIRVPRILDRYILREVTLTWLAVTGVLLIILVTNQMARVLSGRPSTASRARSCWR